jgi:hypothetical protein
MVLSFLESIINPKFLYTIRGFFIEYLVFPGLLLDGHRDVCHFMRTLVCHGKLNSSGNTFDLLCNIPRKWF